METPGQSRLEQERAFAMKLGAENREARERVGRLLDPGSFLEVGTLTRDLTEGRADKTPSDGLIAGYGTIGGHRVGVLSHDVTVLAGSDGHAAAAKEARVIDEAWRARFPVISFGEGGGGRIPDMMGSTLGAAGAIAGHSLLTTLSRADRPFMLIACCMGEMYGVPSFKLGLSDWALMLRSGSLGISGPRVIQAALGEEVTAQELGGPEVHEANGQVTRVEDSEEEMFRSIRAILDFALAPQRESSDPWDRETPEIQAMIPESPSRAYDVRRVIRAIVDRDCEPLYLWPNYGGTVVACLARVGGRSVGVFASQPLVRGGVLDVESSRKGAMFIERCERFRIPLLFLHDVPGFLVGRHAERDGILGAAMGYLKQLSSSTMPKIAVVLRKSYGLAYFAMAGQSAGADYIAALPSARIAFMGPDTGINLLYSRKLAQLPEEERAEAEARMTEEWNIRAEPWEAAHLASIDDVIEPAEVRRTVYTALTALHR